MKVERPVECIPIIRLLHSLWGSADPKVSVASASSRIPLCEFEEGTLSAGYRAW